MQTELSDRKFLFLQGPHGPFFYRLSKHLQKSGCKTVRVGFNAGDSMFWPKRSNFIPFRASADQWPDLFRALLRDRGVTDLVLYGDARKIHAEAIEIATEKGVTLHVFEEGYLRPYWVSYERHGANGFSRLMNMDIAQMAMALQGQPTDLPDAPAHWGDIKHHVFYGALYHFFVFAGRGRYPKYKPHRGLTVVREFLLYLKRLTLFPYISLERTIATFRIRQSGYPYHLALLQLAHDASVLEHSGFDSNAQFIAEVMDGFATGAPAHHHLVFKAHPLEDDRVPLKRNLRKLAKTYGIEDRVHLVRGGKLAALLDTASSAVTINSTAAQQALWRGLPVKAFGRAVYSKPELVSEQPIEAFFANPQPPNMDAYRTFRSYLHETSQLRGGYYARGGRNYLARKIVDVMLDPLDRYDRLATNSSARKGTATPQQQLRLVHSAKD